MSDLIALVLDSREQAQEARQEFMKMQREHLVELEDCVVAPLREAFGAYSSASCCRSPSAACSCP